MLREIPNLEQPQATPDLHREDILSNLVVFCRLLREMGLHVTTGKLIDVCASLKHIQITQKQDFYCALRANLVSRYEELPIFDAAFRAFWEKAPQPEAVDDGCCGDGGEPGLSSEVGPLDLTSLEAAVEEDGPPEERLLPGYSPLEMLTQKDFSTFCEDEVATLRRLIARLAPKIATALSRRRKVDHRGAELDLRRSLRRSLRHGGDIVELMRRRRKVRKLKLVLLCDVSGSMDLYTRFLIQFIYALQNELRGVETFVFSTRLTRITQALRHRGMQQSLQELSRLVPQWSGGTNIGACLKSFNEEIGRGLVDGRTVVIIISDGWDRGETELLAEEMRRLHSKAHKLIWLNPLLGSPSYQPLCKGIRAALPYSDYFLPAHNLESLLDLGRTLQGLSRA